MSFVSRPAYVQGRDKFALCEAFSNDVDQCADTWERTHVIPYANAYLKAHDTFKKTLDARDKAIELQWELFFTVTLLAGGAILAWAPAAAVLAGAQRGFRGNVLLPVAKAMSKRLDTSTHRAYAVLKSFAFGHAKDLAQGLASGPGKTLLTQHATTKMKDTYKAPAHQDVADPQLYQNGLMAGLLAIKGELLALNQAIRDTTWADVDTAIRIHGTLFQTSPFFLHVPLRFRGQHPLANRMMRTGDITRPVAPLPVAKEPTAKELAELQDEMERLMWAQWSLTLKQFVAASYDDRPVAGPRLIPAHYEYRDPTYVVEQRLHKLKVMIPLRTGGSQPAGEFFGGRLNPTFDHEVEQLVRWAQNHIRQKGKHVTDFISR